MSVTRLPANGDIEWLSHTKIDMRGETSTLLAFYRLMLRNYGVTTGLLGTKRKVTSGK